ncbi:MAG: hypothetical protein SGBAC_012529 [Bacillariaceae sp.]
MLSSQSIQSIFSSWDVIKNIPEFQELFSDQLSEKLADSNVAEWFSGPANPHHLVFVKMIDLIVHLLGPDLDVIIEELTSQGRRHHRYHSDMIGFFHVDVFAEISVAFVEIIRTLLLEQASNKDSNTNEAGISEDSVLHPGQLETVTKSWTDFFTMIRAIMKQGVKMEVKRHKRRAEKQRQEIIAKQERRPSESTKSMSDTSSDNGSDFASPVSRAPKTRIGRGKGLSPTRRGIGRALSSGLEAMRSPPGRSTSGIRMRAGMNLLNGGSTSNSNNNNSNNSNIKNNKGSKLAALKELSSPTAKTSKTPLRRGIRSSLSMKKISMRS